jgi:hypothetical protein
MAIMWPKHFSGPYSTVYHTISRRQAALVVNSVIAKTIGVFVIK